VNDLTLDRELVRAMRSGSEQAFNRFFRDYAPRVFRFVLPRVDRDAALAEDLCQEVLLRAMRHIDGWRGEASLFTWLCQMARNVVTDHWRRANRREGNEVLIEDHPSIAAALDSIEGDASAGPEQQQTRSELLRLVQVALDRLPGNYATALELKYVDGCSVAEIATRLDLNGIATQSLLARARGAFRDAFTTLTGGQLHDALPFGLGGGSDD
jgi:RNA polymerase sigma-70 factor, ECF subfamily